MTTFTQDRILAVPRTDFLSEFRRDYQSGQHVTFIGPTQRGKTTLGFLMLQQVISPERRVIIFSGKPPKRDPTMSKAAEKLNLRVIDEWPPTKTLKDRNRNGYVLRPYHTLKDIDADNANLRVQFRKGIQAAYASSKPTIAFIDEAYQFQNELGLKKEYEAILIRGAPVVSAWSLIQRGRYVSYFAYDQAEHILFFWEPDVSNVRRYAEMVGGVDPVYVANVVKQLRTKRVQTGGTISEALYIRRSGPELYIVKTQ